MLLPRTFLVSSIMILVWGGSVLNAEEPDAEGRYLIVHADDAGMSHSVNMATIQGLESRLVSSASIMVPCPWFKEFAVYAREHPQFDYGVHLTLNSEWKLYRWGPVAPRERVPSLVDAEGYLWDNVQLVQQHAKVEEVEIELRAQIQRAREWGIPLTHLDTHMGALLCRPDLVDVYVRLSTEYDLPILFFNRLDSTVAQAYPALADRFVDARGKLLERRLPTVDTVLQFYGGDNPEARRMQYESALAKLPSGVTELIIHCGFDDAELRGITDSAVRRDQDRQLFTSAERLKDLQERGIRLVGWGELRKLQQY